MSTIEDATGGGYGAKVDPDNKLEVRAVSESESQWANEEGDAYNLNSSIINLTGSTDSAVYYYEHKEEDILVIEQIIVGIGKGTSTDPAMIKLIRNPTAGTLISNAVGGTIMANRNFGSSKTLLNSISYKGVDGDTVTDGTDYVCMYQSHNGRLAAPINTELQRGNTIAVTINPQLSTGSCNVYVAFVVHTKAEI